VNSNLAPEKESSALPDPRWAAAWRWLPILIILAAAFTYYGSYWRYWFNPHDEGGTACLIAQRLMNGERPWVDVEPGYNIGWFYPLIALFKITGVNYLAARAWFFALSTITALLGFGIVSRISGSRLAGLGAGLLLVMLPGSQFKNYIQLAQAANTACLIYLAFIDPAKRGKWLGAAALGGVVLGLTYLVRVELGFFFTAIWTLLFLVFLLDRRLPGLRRLGTALAGVAALAGGVIVAQTPAYLDLRGRGLEVHYWAEYTGWFDFLRTSLAEEFETKRISSSPPASAALAATPAPESAAAVSPAPEEPRGASATMHDATRVDRNILSRKPLSAIWHGVWRDRLLAALTYAPFIGFGVFFCAGLFGFLRSVGRGEFTLQARPLLWLLLVGTSLTTFPQFFLFRPDRPHLSEFMTGHIIAMAACLWLLWPRGEGRPLLLRLCVWSMAIFLAGHLLLFTAFAMQHPSSGTIAARTGRKTWFQGENGVHVREFKKQAASFQGIHDAVLKASGPDDYVVCFPYMPGYNVMTNRRTYLRNVYVDNATRSVNWATETIRDFEEKRPAVVIIDDRAINGTEASRFSRWAPKVHHYLKEHYTLANQFETVEVFTRAAPPAQQPIPVAQ
jgi:hypothetical protein